MRNTLAITTHLDASAHGVVQDYLMARGFSHYCANMFLRRVLIANPGTGVSFTEGVIRYTFTYVNPENGRDYYDVSMNNLVA